MALRQPRNPNPSARASLNSDSVIRGSPSNYKTRGRRHAASRAFAALELIRIDRMVIIAENQPAECFRIDGFVNPVHAAIGEGGVKSLIWN